MKYASGEVYDGEWKSNHRTGYGKIIEKDGSVYEGN